MTPPAFREQRAGGAGGEDKAGPARTVDLSAVDTVLTASRSLMTITVRSIGPAAAAATIVQYRALVVLFSRGPQRLVDLAAALGVAPSTAGRMCDRLVRKGLVRRHRHRGDRRAVLVSVTAAGRQVVAQAAARRRALITEALARLPFDTQLAAAEAFRAFAQAADEISDHWPPVAEVPAPRQRPVVDARSRS